LAGSIPNRIPESHATVVAGIIGAQESGECDAAERDRGIVPLSSLSGCMAVAADWRSLNFGFFARRHLEES